MNVRITLALALILAVFAVLGCSSSLFPQQPALERHFYLWQAARDGSAPAPGGETTLKVRPFSVSPGFDNRELVTNVGEQRFESDYYNLFFTLPGPALTQAAREWMSQAGVFAHVVDSTSQALETHCLEGNLEAIYGDYTNPGSPQAVVAVQFFLLKESKGNYLVIFQKSYREKVPMAAASPGELAAGLQTGLKAVLTRLEADLRQTMAAR